MRWGCQHRGGSPELDMEGHHMHAWVSHGGLSGGLAVGNLVHELRNQQDSTGVILQGNHRQLCHQLDYTGIIQECNHTPRRHKHHVYTRIMQHSNCRESYNQHDTMGVMAPAGLHVKSDS